MKPIVQALAAVVGSLALSLSATVLLRRLALMAHERQHDASAQRPPGPVVVVIMPIIGNQWLTGNQGRRGGKQDWMGRLTAGRQHARRTGRR